MSAANLNSQIKSIMASIKDGQPTSIQQEKIFNLTEDLAIALGINDDPPASQEERDTRMAVAEKRNKKCTDFNNKLAELRAGAMKGDSNAQGILKTAQSECHAAISEYNDLPDRIEKLKLQRRQIEKVQGGGKRRKTRKARKTRKHRK